MSTAIVPKSQIRKSKNIVKGYGEVPFIDLPEKDVTYWGLPGGAITFDKKKATAMAYAIDKYIKRIIKDPEQLIYVTP